MKIDPNEPAFPYQHGAQSGLTIRMHLAAMAMQGLLSCQSSSMNLPGDAVAIADSLIAELNKENAK